MISLKVLVDKKQNRIVFAEADKDFVDILLSFLTFPMGTIVRLIQKQPHPAEIGCLNSLYSAVEKLETNNFHSDKHKAILLHPVNSSGHMCRKLEFNIDDTEPITNLVNDYSITSDPVGAVFVHENSKFMISDDLKIMPISSSSSFALLNTFGAHDLHVLEEKILKFGMAEILTLLKLSWLSKTPLTDLYLMKHPDRTIEFSLLFELACFKNPVNCCSKLSLMVYLRKSDGKFLYVEAKEDFIDYLLSILSIPLGAVVKLLESPPVTCISNLYKSVKELNVDRDIKEESHRAKLIAPEIAPQFSYKIQLLGISESFGSKKGFGFGTNSNAFGYVQTSCSVEVNGFVKKPSTFIVMDDLSFTPLSPIANLFVLNKLNVRICDMEELAVSFGGEEALRLLAASLTTKSALTYALKLNEKKPNIET